MPNDTLFSRREFLKTSSMLALGATAPSFLLNSARAAGTLSKGEPILVVVQLAGGNDGLNTVVPYTDDAYYRARKRLALKGDQIIKLDDEIALAEPLKALMPWAEKGELAIVEGVGYPNPDRSHFRSTEIWETAVDSNQTLSTGWIGRYLDNSCSGRPECAPTTALAVGRSERPQSFEGPSGLGVAVASPEGFGYTEGQGGDTESNFAAINSADSQVESSGNSSLDFLRQTTMNATLSASQVRSAARKYRGGVSYPNGRLSQSLKTVARMISGRMPTRIYYVSHTGFDTHANQMGSHQNLIRQLGEGLAAFQRDLEQMGEADRVTIMTFSEFGRRVAENGSGGTDHGTAAPLFMLGKHVGGGLHGQRPSLTDLDKGDLKYTMDFRRVYASVLQNWLKTGDTSPVLGRSFEPIPGLIRA